MPIEAHFGESPPWSVGVEEELMVVDADSLALVPRAAELIDASEDVELPGVLKSELFASALELNCGTCDSAAHALNALVQGLCATVLDGDAPAHDPAARGLYQQNRWAAARFGMKAELFHPDGERVAKASELAAELIELARPAAETLGADSLLNAFDVERSESDRQLEVRQADGLKAVCADLCQRTLSSP